MIVTSDKPFATLKWGAMLLIASFGVTMVATPDQANSRENDVVSDRFALQWEIDETNLSLAIDTDLPDTTEVIVSVSRLYYEVGDTATYARRYFEEKGRVSKWRTPRQISVDDEIWKADLKEHQSKMARLSSELAFEIDHIEDQIVVQAVVHLNQPDPRFGGRGSPNLSGAAVTRIAGSSNSNIIKAQKEIERPLAGAQPPSKSQYVSYDGLKKGKTYRLLEETPLMAASPSTVASLGYEETMEVLGKTLYIPAGRLIHVVSIDRSQGPANPWYEVEVIGGDSATGWINSTALMGEGVIRE